MDNYWNKILNLVQGIREKNRFRETKSYTGIDFCSNDYLGLSSDPKILEQLTQINGVNHVGATASRLVRGNSEYLEKFEMEFSKFVHSESALVVNTGYAANFGLLDTIANSNTIVFTDRLNHASILDGIRIAGAIKKYYHHLDLDHLESLLQKSMENPKEKDKQRIVVTETLFSMDGDVPNLKKLISLKEKYNFVLVVDEAHALGVFGENGRGLLFEQLSLEEIEKIEYRVYTLGKSLGIFGGVIATSNIGRDHLVNVMRTFIFSTALPPLIPFIALQTLEKLKRMDVERKNLLSLVSEFKKRIQNLGFQITASTTHIIPILMKDEEEALRYSGILQEKGFDVRAIRPPTVESARLRISFNTKIQKVDMDRLIDTLSEIRIF